MASTPDDALYTALMDLTRELSRVGTALDILARNDADKEARLRKVEERQQRFPATLYAAILGAVGSVYMAANKLTGKG